MATQPAWRVKRKDSHLDRGSISYSIALVLVYLYILVLKRAEK